MSTATTEHPASRRMKLRRAGLSERTDLDSATAQLLDAADESASPDQLRAIAQGKMKQAKRVKVKYPEDVRTAYKRALELTGTPENGGPKYPLTVKQSDAIKRALASKGKQVAAVRGELDKVSNAALLKMAKGQKSAPAEGRKVLRAFLNAHPTLREDRTMYARKGAALVLAYREAQD